MGLYSVYTRMGISGPAASAGVCVVCVCVRACVCARATEFARERQNVCACMRAGERVCVCARKTSVCKKIGVRERLSVRACVNTCVRETERQTDRQTDRERGLDPP